MSDSQAEVGTMSVKKIVFGLFVALVSMGQTSAPPGAALPIKVTITEVAPPSMVAGGPPVTMHLAGTGFVSGVTIAFSGTGVKGQVVATATTATVITAQVTADPDAQPGPRVVTATNLNQSSNAGQTPPAVFTIIAAPHPTVAVRSVSPVAMMIAEPPVLLTVAGSGFQQGAKLQIAGVDATVTAVQPGSISAMASSPAGTQAGPRNVIVVNPDGSSNNKLVPAVQFTLQPPRPKNPTIDSITPATFQTGASNVMFKITGSNFQSGAQVQLQSAGMSLASVTVVNGTTIVGTMSVAPTEPPGTKALNVTNPGGMSNVPGPHVTVVAGTATQGTATQATPPGVAPPPAAPAPPQVRSVTPATIQIGAPPATLTIVGSNFRAGANVQIASVNVNVVSVQPTTITVMASAASGAAPGPQNIIVINADQTSNANQSPAVQLTLQPAPPAAPPPAPQVRSVTPATLQIGAPPATLTIVGSNFRAGANVQIASVNVNVVSVQPTTITVTASAASSAAPGPENIVVINADQTSNASQVPAVQITLQAAPQTAPPPIAPPPAPQVRSVTPASLQIGAPPVTLTIAGANFRPGATVQIPSVSVNVTSVQPTAITANASSAPGAAPGPENIIVINTDQTSNANQVPAVQITLQPAPTTAPPPTTKPPAPLVRSVTPSSLQLGDPQVPLTVSGANFQPGAILQIANVATNVTSVQPNTITAYAAPTSAATPSSPNVIVVNPDQQSNAAQQPAVQIALVPRPQQQPKAPLIESVTPATIQAGSSNVMFKITGANFEPGAHAQFAFFTGSLSGVTVLNANTIAGRLSVGATEPLGPKAVVVTNPGGAASAPGPHVTVVAPPTTTTQPPPTTTQPPPTTTQPPPTTTQPPPTTTTQPPTTLPKITPPALPPLAPPKPPLSNVKGPRIEVVEPAELIPGKQYELKIKGKNLTSKTALSFGDGVTVVGAPFFISSAEGTVHVDVTPAAPLGTHAAVASDATGSNVGPGGILVSLPGGKKGPPLPTPKVATPLIPKPKFHQPKGEIILDTPCDPDIGGSSQCKQPPGLDQSTPFSWHEKNPNIAKFFVYEIVDDDAQVLFTAQTTNKYFHLSAANLASLPKIETASGKNRFGTTLGGGNSKGTSVSSSSKASLAKSAGTSGGVVPAVQKLGVAPPVKPGDVKGINASIAAGGAFGIKGGPERAQLAGRAPAVGEVYWRVTGFAQKIDEFTGKKLADTISVESSAQRPIVLPLPPNGFSCDSGTPGTNVGPMSPLLFTYIYKKPPKPCLETSLNICSAADFAEFPTSATVNLTRIPFPIDQKGDGASEAVVFQNVFVDWGDGTEPQVLEVKGKFAKNLNNVKLVLPGTDDNKRLRHLYINKDKDAEYVTYKIRIFSLADPDATPPTSVSYVSFGESVSSGSVVTASYGGPGTGKAGAQPAALPAGKSGSMVGATMPGTSASAGFAAVKAGISPKMFTIACEDVRVYNPWGEGADEPIHLLAANIVFPTDSDETKQIIRTSFGKGTAVLSALPPGMSAASEARGVTSAAPQGAVAAGPKGAAATSSGASRAPATGKGGLQLPATPGPAMSKAPLQIDESHIAPIPDISDCSSAFKAAAQIAYYGHGKVRLYWYVDGVLVETTEPPSELPHVSKADGEAGKKQQLVVMMSALPAALQNPPHKIELRVEGGMKPQPLGAVALPPSYTLGASQHSGSQVGQTFTAPSGPVMAPPKARPPGGGVHGSGQGGPLEDPAFEPDPIDFEEGGSGGSSGVAVHTSLPAKSSAGPSGTFIQIPAGTSDPYTEVEAPKRYYQVIDHKIKGWPCALRYPTLGAGTFQITDLSAFTKSGDGDAATYSGTGLLNLLLPGNDPNATSLQPVSVSFSGWKLVATNAGDEDVLDVKGGSLTQSVDTSLTAAGFPMSIKKVSLTPADLTIEGTVGVTSTMGFKNDVDANLPKWTFPATRLTADGDFTFASSSAVSSTLGASPFTVSITGAVIDFSRSVGDPPNQSCSPPSDAKNWQGILISGVMSAPDTIEFNNVKLLKNYSFDKWGVEPSGLSANFSDPSYTKSVSTSGVQINAKGFEFAMCSGGALKVSFGVQVKNPPLVVQDISGKISVDELANMMPSFPAVSIDKDWGIVKAHISHAELAFDSSVGAWNINVNAHVKYVLPSTGKTVYEHDYNGIQVTLEGNVFGPGGKTFFPVDGAGTANIAGYPMEVTALGVGTADGGGIWFGFKGDLTVGDNAPVTHDRETKFSLQKTTVARTRWINPDYELASIGGGALEYDGFDYSSSEADGVKIADVHLDFDFPPGSKTVHVSADCHWETSDNAFRFVGQGSAEVADSIAIDVGVIFGHVADESYWIVKAKVTMPAPITLGSTGFALFAIGGGLGYNISGASYDMGDFTKVTLDHKKDYSFSAAVDVGTVDDGFTIYGRGRLTIIIGPDAGARIDIKLWLLTTKHEEPPLAEACIQYVGGNFDAGVTLHLSVADGLISLDAPKFGDDVCTQTAVSIHFGGADWHVWVGTIDHPITGHILVIDGSAYFMIDKDGFRTGLKVTAHFYWEGSGGGFGAYAGFDGGVEVKVNITWTPFHVFGSVHGWVTGEAGVIVFGDKYGISFGIDFMISMSAMPIEVCGSLDVYIKLSWPLPNINLSVGPVCLGG
jgi:Quinohemoprotein amine dehydrogenase, alpha subunit domain III